jgi:hypothetical protein
MSEKSNSPINHPAGDQALDQSGLQPARRQRILTTEGKLEVLHLLSLGLSMVEIAKRVGVSTRGIRKAADVDPVFKQRIQRNRGDIDVLCRQTLKEAAGEVKYWRCIPLLRELSNPNPEKKHDAKPEGKSEDQMLEEFRAVFYQILDVICRVITDPAQRAQLDREFAKIDPTCFQTQKQRNTPSPQRRNDKQFPQQNR